MKIIYAGYEFAHRDDYDGIHGSQGCCAYHRSALTRHYKEPVSAATSSFTEGASVFGGQANLMQAFSNIFTVYNPEIIAVHTTCLSETIGDDLPQQDSAIMRSAAACCQDVEKRTAREEEETLVRTVHPPAFKCACSHPASMVAQQEQPWSQADAGDVRRQAERCIAPAHRIVSLHNKGGVNHLTKTPFLHHFVILPAKMSSTRCRAVLLHIDGFTEKTQRLSPWHGLCFEQGGRATTNAARC